MSMKKGAIIVSFLAVVFVVKISIYHTGSITTNYNEKTYLSKIANLLKQSQRNIIKHFKYCGIINMTIFLVLKVFLIVPMETV
jgi:hypothetical protein